MFLKCSVICFVGPSFRLHECKLNVHKTRPVKVGAMASSVLAAGVHGP